MNCMKNLLYPIVLVVTLLQTAKVVHSQSIGKELSPSILDFTGKFSPHHARKDVVGRASLVWSPLSLYQAMLMAGDGANGNTFKEFERITHLKTKEEYRQWSKDFLNDLKKNSDANNRYNTSLKIANRLYVDQKFNLDSKFNDVLNKYYNSQLESIDFSEKEKSAKQINEWVSDQTNKIIKNIVKGKDINQNTRLMLVNALYFKAPWAKPFISKSTSKKNFNTSYDNTIQLETMQLTSHFSYHNDTGNKTQWINLPYKGNRYVLTLALPQLPQHDNRLYQTEAYLQNSTVLLNIFDALDNQQTKPTRVNLSLPKFRIESSLNFVEHFKAYYNVTLPFDPKNADFSSMSSRRERDLFISKVIHKSVINVDEAGTEAAAVTAIQMDARSGMHLYEKPIDLSFSRPFLFYLRDTQTKVLLFVGRFTGIL